MLAHRRRCTHTCEHTAHMKTRGHGCALPGDHPRMLTRRRGSVSVSRTQRHFGPTNAPGFQAVQECMGFSRNESCERFAWKARFPRWQVARVRKVAQPGGHPLAPCWLLQPKAAECSPSNGCSLGHKLPSKMYPGSLQQRGEVPHTDTPQRVPRTTWGLTLAPGARSRLGQQGSQWGEE